MPPGFGSSFILGILVILRSHLHSYAYSSLTSALQERWCGYTYAWPRRYSVTLMQISMPSPHLSNQYAFLFYKTLHSKNPVPTPRKKWDFSGCSDRGSRRLQGGSPLSHRVVSPRSSCPALLLHVCIQAPDKHATDARFSRLGLVSESSPDLMFAFEMHLPQLPHKREIRRLGM